MSSRLKAKTITEGAIYIAIYAILAILTRYLILATDSIIYYFYPIPIFIYTLKNSFKISVITSLGSIFLSFIFANPIYVLGLIMPNILLGFLFGILDKYSKLKIINYLLMFILLFLTDYLSVYIYGIISGVSYFDETFDLFINIINKFFDVSPDILSNVLEISTSAVLLIDSFVKLLLIIFISLIIIQRLKLVPDYHISFKIPLRYSFLIGIGYILFCYITVTVLRLSLTNHNTFLNMAIALLYTVLFIFSFYLIYQAIFAFRLWLSRCNNIVFVLVILFSVLLFPISILIGLILNLINFNYINAAMK